MQIKHDAMRQTGDTWILTKSLGRAFDHVPVIGSTAIVEPCNLFEGEWVWVCATRPDSVGEQIFVMKRTAFLKHFERRQETTNPAPVRP